IVHVIDDTPEPHTPDSLFPNNWVSFHADGSVVLYPMLAPNRRAERRNDVLEALSASHGFRIARVLDLTAHESRDKFLEGTGSLVLDRVHRVAYACVSPRTDVDVLGDFAQQLDYDVVAFEAVDAAGAAIYHTNVLMCVGTRFAAVCSACIREDERAAVIDALRTTGHSIVDLSMEQLAAFAGNMLELRSARAGGVVAMSTRARDSLSPQQRGLIEQHAGPIVAAPIPTIETLGGGSVRCMLAEIHLPKK
ncbi:MAG TPA: arginine deiminase-related protein, partial [Steroidobacteraceae bacterium]|nr:arginine deiminase-related protein [Steroidobacteraceae bacterium]